MSPEEVRDEMQPINGEAPNSPNSSASLPESIGNMEESQSTSEGSQNNNSSSRDLVISTMADDAKSQKETVETNKEPGDIHSLHPITKLLTISDLESCCVLEEAAFDKPEERATREKFNYRLTACGELCLGIFTSAVPGSLNAATLATGRPVETGHPRVGVLLAHIVATRSMDNVATDEAMDVPQDWNSKDRTASTKGHREEGRTIILHSLAVLPNFQGKSLGRTLLSAYISMMNGTGIADRIALIAHEHNVPFYEKMGFENKGPSKAEFGGGSWIDMVRELQPAKKWAKYG